MFRFKQFTIQQQSVSMKVNTDGVLLGAWATVDNAKKIIDVGTGTGVIALMMAQRNADTAIDAVEIDERSAQQAQENVDNSPWAARINVVCQSFQGFAEQCTTQYDLVVSNPPYFVEALLSPSAARTLSRHAATLTHGELIAGVKKILAPHGRFCVVLPVAEGMQFIELVATQQLFCTCKTIVYSTRNKPPRRLLLQFALVPAPLAEDELCIHETDSDQYTRAYQELTGEFYLKF